MLQRFEVFSSAISFLHRTMLGIERDVMVKAGYKGSYATCLVALARSGDGMTAAALCRRCDKDKAGISRILSDMISDGLICRTGDKNLYRAKIALTQKGQKVAQFVCRKAEAAVAVAGAEMTEEERILLYGTLSKIAANLKKIRKNGIPENIE